MYSSRSRERCTVEVERNQETDTQYHFTSLNRAANAFNQNKEWEWMFEGHYKGMVKWHCKYIYRTEIKACGLDWHITWSMDFQPNSEINVKLVNWRDGRTDTECTVSVWVCTHAARSFIYLDESCTPLLPVNTWLAFASYWPMSAALWPPIGQLLHLNLPCKQRRCHHNLQCKGMILVSILRI